MLPPCHMEQWLVPQTIWESILIRSFTPPLLIAAEVAIVITLISVMMTLFADAVMTVIVKLEIA